MEKSTFQAKVTKCFPNGYNIETVIDGSLLRGIIFPNKSRPEQSPCNDSIRNMGSVETDREKQNDDYISVRGVKRPSQTNVDNLRQADVSSGDSIRNEAQVGDATAEMKSPSPSYASPAPEVLRDNSVPGDLKTFQAKVTKCFPNSYDIETVIDGNLLRGLIFPNEPRTEQTPSNSSIRNMGSRETYSGNQNGDHNSVREVTRPSETNVSDFQQADVSDGSSIRNEAPVRDATTEMKIPSYASPTHEVLRDNCIPGDLKKTFQAKVTKRFPSGYNIETVIDGSRLHGLIFPNKPRPEKTPCNDAIRNMRSGKTDRSKQTGDHCSAREITRPSATNINDFQQADVSGGNSIRNEAHVRDTTAEMRSSVPSYASPAHEVCDISESSIIHDVNMESGRMSDAADCGAKVSKENVSSTNDS